MSKPIKKLITAELHKAYANVDSACVVDVTGLDVGAQEAIRRALGKKSARLRVVKNSLAKRAFQGTLLEPLGNALEGPCALVTGAESLIEAAKVLVEAVKEHENLTLKQALVDGDPELLSVAAVAKMKSKDELLGEIAAAVSSPGRALAGCLSSPQSKIAGCLKGMIEQAA